MDGSNRSKAFAHVHFVETIPTLRAQAVQGVICFLQLHIMVLPSRHTSTAASPHTSGPSEKAIWKQASFQSRFSPYFSKRIFPIQRRYKFFIFNKFFILHGSATSEAQTAPISPKVKNFVPNQGIYNLLPVAIMEEAV
ncbi:hypothetical protein [uncultured Bilophila sp.]|uniref:hypothetical protein n=1 Tax=uncultured Bilophila sp. TaxID=529385 RepID=UPI00280C21CA|nr:hypothetical protein [uncultured Bilophila sp.]